MSTFVDEKRNFGKNKNFLVDILVNETKTSYNKISVLFSYIQYVSLSWFISKSSNVVFRQKDSVSGSRNYLVLAGSGPSAVDGVTRADPRPSSVLPDLVY